MKRMKKICLYAVLAAIALIMLLPFYMMFVMSTLTTNEIYSFPPHIWFGGSLAKNFHTMMEQADIIKAFLTAVL